MTVQDFLTFFTDPVLRAPTWGCIFMGLASGLVGVIVFLRKQSLLGESLSHAAYPGAIAGILFSALFFPGAESMSFWIMAGAALTALLSIYVIHWLETKKRIASDTALCFVLATTFGIGVTIASHIQFTQTTLYRQMLTLLYGQAATMTDFHIVFYGILALVVITIILLLYKEIEATSFDRSYSASLGIPVKRIEFIIFTLLVLAVIIGIRTVGVVLMSAMLIAPPVAARQFTNKLSHMFILAGAVGMLSGLLGNIFSVSLSYRILEESFANRLSIPTGPMIVLVGAAICLFALLAAPQRGLIPRSLRIAKFRYQCLCENILKFVWRHQDQHPVTTHEIAGFHSSNHYFLMIALKDLQKQGWLKSTSENTWELTQDGKARAQKIVRLHRLWEVYLADYLGVGAERVHRNAEEMEHIITPELERALTTLLKDPKMDPHQQPIPARDAYEQL